MKQQSLRATWLLGKGNAEAANRKRVAGRAPHQLGHDRGIIIPAAISSHVCVFVRVRASGWTASGQRCNHL